MKDSQIVDLYWKRDESAITETDKAYGHYCYTVGYRILYDASDTEECVNDTWLTAWNTIPPQRPLSLKYYLAKIIRNLAMNVLRINTAKKRGEGETQVAFEELEAVLASGTDPEKEYEAEELKETIRDFVHTLPKKERNVFLRRYFWFETSKEIAQMYRLSESNVNVILSRTRTKLKEHLRKEGYL